MISMKELYLNYKKPHVEEVGFRYYGKLINIISIPLTIPLLYTNITPNQITIFWHILGLATCILFTLGTYIHSLIAVLLLNLTWVIDAIDGTIARYKSIKSFEGNYLEFIAHISIDSFMFTCISFGIFIRHNNLWFMALGSLASISSLLYHLTSLSKISLFVNDKIFKEFKNKKVIAKENIINKRTAKIFAIIQNAYSTNTYFMVLLPLAYFDMLPLFLLFYGITFPILIAIKYTYEIKRGYSWVNELFKNKEVYEVRT